MEEITITRTVTMRVNPEKLAEFYGEHYEIVSRMDIVNDINSDFMWAIDQAYGTYVKAGAIKYEVK